MSDVQTTLIAALKDSGIDKDWTKERVMEVVKPLLTSAQVRGFGAWLDQHLDHLIAVCGG